MTDREEDPAMEDEGYPVNPDVAKMAKRDGSGGSRIFEDIAGEVTTDKPWHKDSGKVRGPLVMAPNACLEVAKVFGAGATKYPDVDGVPNWLHYAEETEITEYAWSLERHFMGWLCGHDIDSESGIHALAHVVADALMILEAHELYQDNRSIK